MLSLWYGRRRESCAQINVVMGPSCCRVAEREEVEGYTIWFCWSWARPGLGLGHLGHRFSAFWLRSSSGLMALDLSSGCKGHGKCILGLFSFFPFCVGSSFLSPLNRCCWLGRWVFCSFLVSTPSIVFLLPFFLMETS